MLQAFALAVFVVMMFSPTLVCFAATKGQATSSPANGEGEQKFLFIVETSSASRGINEASRQAVYDLILGGVYRQMRAGDSFGLWTFNEEPRFDFSKQDWTPDAALELASNTTVFLRAQKWRKKANFGPLLAKLDSVVTSVKDLTVFVISLGDPPLEGTVLDSKVNAEYERRASERKKAKKPFITTIIARRGRIVHANVTLPGEKIALPERQAVTVTQNVSTPTNTVPPRRAVGFMIQRNPTNTSLSGDAFVTTTLPESKRVELPATNLAVTTAPPPTNTVVVPPTTNTIVTVAIVTETNAAIVPDTNQPPLVVTEPRTEGTHETAARGALPRIRKVTSPTALPELNLAVPKVDIVQQESTTEALPPEEKPLLPLPGQVTASARELQPTPPAVPIIQVATFSFTTRMLLWTGVGLLAVAVLLLLLLFHRSRPARQGSIISRSLDRR
jgi:hypothetical protein